MPELRSQESRKVTIGGENFNLLSDGKAEEVDAIVGYINVQLQKAEKAIGSGDRYRAAVLAMLNISGELWDVKAAREKQDAERSRLQMKLEELLDKTKDMDA